MKKFSLKAAAVAAALVVSGAASAASGDLYIEVYDPTTLSTFVEDLGSPVTPSTGSETLSLGSAFTSFYNSGDGDEYFLVGGASRTGDISFSGTIGTPSQSQLNTIFGGDVTTVITAAIGTASETVLSSSSPASFTNLGGTTNFGGLATQNVDATVGTSMNLEYFATTATPVAVGPVSLSGTGALTIGTSSSPTPEPGTYALMMAGLLAVGAIVRRRASR